MLTLVKFADLKAMLDLEKDSIDDYPKLKVLTESVYAAIETYIGRWLELDTYTETVKVDGKFVPLHALPIVSVASVTVDGAAVDVATCTVRAFGLDLPMEARGGTVVVVYEGGLEETNGQLKRASLMQTLHEWSRRNNIGATSITVEGGSTSWPEFGLLKEVRRVLDPMLHASKLF